MTDETIFASALEKTDPIERAAFLDQACEQNAELRRRVEGLLEAHAKAGPFLNQPAVESHPDQTLAHGEGHDDSDDISTILTPSENPDSLGWIGHYEVFEVLGRGGFGIVFRAFDDVLQRVVAVKVLNPSMAATSPARKRFLREARSSAQVRHENVVLVHAVEEQPYPFLVMEFIPGETLQQCVDRTGPLDIREVVRIGRQIADGLAAAHATGLIHRDIKPSNILIETNPLERVKITDFGLARAADDASLTRSGVVAGTPMYMAPEQARGDSLDHRADLFSLGSVLYLMCTGRPPFRASTTFAVLKRVAEESPRPIREIIPEVPTWFCRIVEKLHAKNPADRFQTASEVADILADCEKQLKDHKEVRNFSRIPGAGKSPTRPNFKKFATALCGIAALFWAAILFAEPAYRYATNQAAIEVSPAVGISHLIVWRNGQVVTDGYDARTNPTITLPPGRYRLDAKISNGKSIERWELVTRSTFSSRSEWQGTLTPEFEIARGEKVTLRAIMRDVPTSTSQSTLPPTAQIDDGFVPLFNGKDLTGWKNFPSDRTSWKVENGILVGKGKPSHLFSERGNFENFHLRMETRVKKSTKAGAVGVYTRVPLEDPRMLLSPFGEAGLFRSPVPKLYDDKMVPIVPAPPTYRENPIVVWALDHKGEHNNIKALPAEEWFTHELIVDDKNVTVKTESKEHSSRSFIVAGAPATKGHIALQLFDDWSVVEFRKIEIKELPGKPE